MDDQKDIRLSPEPLERGDLIYTNGNLSLDKPQPGEKLGVEDWVWLDPGQRVHVERQYDAASGGVIDVIAHDASIFWVWLDNGRGRVAIHEDDNVRIRLE